MIFLIIIITIFLLALTYLKFKDNLFGTVLICNKSSTTNETRVIEKMQSFYKFNKLQQTTQDYTITTINESGKDSITSIKTVFDKLSLEINKLSGIKTTVDETKDKYKLSVNIDYTKVDHDKMEEIDNGTNINLIFRYDQGINIIKDTLKMQGYSCK